MIKRIFCAVSLLCLCLPMLLPLAGCSSSENVQTLRVYNWEDYISTSDDEGESIDLIAKFEEENPGVRVEYSTFGTNENMYNELKIGGGGYDLVCPSDYMIMKMIAEDMCEPFTEEFLQESHYAQYASPYIRELFDRNYAEVNGEKRYWSEYSVPYMWGTMGYVYNPELVDPHDMESWAGIWKEANAGKSTIKDSVRDSYFLGVAYVYREELAALAQQYGVTDLSSENYTEYNDQLTEIMNRTDEQTLDAVKDALLTLKENLYGFEVDSGKQDIVTGKISINFAWSGDAVTAMNDAEPQLDEETGELKQGVYLNYAVPEECSNIWFDGWVMPKGANVELAQKFIDFLSDPENAVANMNFIGYTSAIAGDAVFDEMLDWYDESEDADPDDLVAYDLNYFFAGTGEDENRDYTIYVTQENVNRQISAQYPNEAIVARSAVMRFFDDETNAAVNELWEEVKGLPIPGWAYLVIAVIAAGILLIATPFLYKGKRSEHKPKKGYRRVSGQN